MYNKVCVQFPKILERGIALVDIFDCGVQVMTQTDDYDGCYRDCPYHNMTPQQKLYYEFSQKKKNCAASDHMVCYIKDGTHSDPSINGRVNASNCRNHFSAHSSVVKRNIMLSYTSRFNMLIVFYVYI